MNENQPNLNLVGFETIITLHTPTHQHRSSTSTRNNDRRGLKFCRRHYQAKLTTNQHNFNPTIFKGGGSYILHLGLTLPFWPNIFLPTFFLPKIFFVPKFLWPKKFLTQKNFFIQIFFLPKFFLTDKFFLDPQIFLTKTFFYPNFF